MITTWLWPDKTIGKRESRKLREEHNAAVTVAHELAEALEGLADCAGITALHGFRDELNAAMVNARKAIATAREAGIRD